MQGVREFHLRCQLSPSLPPSSPVVSPLGLSVSLSRHSDRPRSEIDGSACGCGKGGRKVRLERRDNTLKYLDVSLTSWPGFYSQCGPFWHPLTPPKPPPPRLFCESYSCCCRPTSERTHVGVGAGGREGGESHHTLGKRIIYTQIHNSPGLNLCGTWHSMLWPGARAACVHMLLDIVARPPGIYSQHCSFPYQPETGLSVTWRHQRPHHVRWLVMPLQHTQIWSGCLRRDIRITFWELSLTHLVLVMEWFANASVTEFVFFSSPVFIEFAVYFCVRRYFYTNLTKDPSIDFWWRKDYNII